jgi:phospholipid transport system substrate-binding protein
MGGGLAAHAQTSQDPKAFADALGHDAVTILQDKALSEDAKRQKLEDLFAQNVDIDWVGQFVLGRYWKSATDAQKAQYLTNYRSFILSHYTSDLAEFTDVNFEVAKVAPDDRGGNIVTVRIKRPNAEDTIVDYTVRAKDGHLKVYDIAVEGVSMITTQRSEFNSVASQHGVDYLIGQLAERSKKDTTMSKQKAQ